MTIGILLCLLPLPAQAEGGKMKDLDNDGYAEAEIFYEGKLISKMIIDSNGDGKTDSTVFYKNGMRERAETDIDFDGAVDTWVKYYITGVPWVIIRDKNNDGRPDYWKYIKNGFVYKREWDRNLDGKADVRMIVPGKSDLREADEPFQKLEKHFDDDYDGVFEKVVKVKKRMPHIKVQTTAGAVGEF